MEKTISPCNLCDLNGSSSHLSVQRTEEFALISVMAATYFFNS